MQKCHYEYSVMSEEDTSDSFFSVYSIPKILFSSKPVTAKNEMFFFLLNVVFETDTIKI
jgi:hypothetical protein